MARAIRRYGGLALALLLANLAIGFAVFVLRANASPSAGGEGEELVAQLRHLRAELHDYAGARSLAEVFLDSHPNPSQLRHRVEYEYALTYYGEQHHASALPLLEDLVATYAVAQFAQGPGALVDEAVVVDDAQFYIAWIKQVTGDVAGAETAYQALFATFSGSNRECQGLMRLAGLYEQQQSAEQALARFQQVVSEFPQTEYAPEAQIHVGHLRLARGEYNESASAFESVADNWPDTRFAATALQFLNRALIHHELSAREPEPGHLVESTVDHAAAIAANVQRLLRDYPACEERSGVLLDAINYRARRIAVELAPRDSLAEIAQIADVMRTVAPEARETMFAKLNQADILTAAGHAGRVAVGGRGSGLG